MTTNNWRDEFREFWDKNWYETRKGHSCIGRNTLMESTESFISLKIEEAKEEVKAKCLKIFIEEVDWAEWARSEEDVKEIFEEAYLSPTSDTK